jgi:hypothetical protein
MHFRLNSFDSTKKNYDAEGHIPPYRLMKIKVLSLMIESNIRILVEKSGHLGIEYFMQAITTTFCIMNSENDAR